MPSMHVGIKLLEHSSSASSQSEQDFTMRFLKTEGWLRVISSRQTLPLELWLATATIAKAILSTIQLQLFASTKQIITIKQQLISIKHNMSTITQHLSLMLYAISFGPFLRPRGKKARTWRVETGLNVLATLLRDDMLALPQGMRQGLGWLEVHGQYGTSCTLYQYYTNSSLTGINELHICLWPWRSGHFHAAPGGVANKDQPWA
jgi:hypothetical protein